MTDRKIAVGDHVCRKSSSGSPQTIGVVLDMSPGGACAHVAWIGSVKDWRASYDLRIVPKEEVVRWWKDQK